MILNSLTLEQAHKGLSEKEFSSLELTRQCLAEIKKKDSAEINAFINILEESALEQAKKADEKISQGLRINKVEGIPLAVKDNILIKGHPATAGSKILENYKAAYDAAVIEKLKARGSVFIGKTNMDEFALGSSTESSYFGPTKNPRDPERVPGGSSGGSAAAVAANECIAALGSDTGGSIRQPASLCGVVGLKPTYGRVSRYGLMAMASSLDQIGPLTKTVEDANILFNSIKGSDPKDSTTKDAEDTDEKLDGNIKGKIIGIPKEYFISGLDPEIEERIKQAIKTLEGLGAKIEEISMPNAKYALAVYYIIMPAEVSSNLSRFDGIRYGFSTANMPDADGLMEVYIQSRTAGFGAEAKRRIMLGTYVLSSGYYDAYYLKAQKARRLVSRDFEESFKKVDCIATPTSPCVAFKIGDKTDDPLTMYLSDIFTVSANIAGVPAISIPCGDSKDGLPIGFQLIGKHFDEKNILNAAFAYESASK